MGHLANAWNLLSSRESYRILWRALREEPWQLILLNLYARLSGNKHSRIELAEKLYYPSAIRQEKRETRKLLRRWTAAASDQLRVRVIHICRKADPDTLLGLLDPTERAICSYQHVPLQSDGVDIGAAFRQNAADRVNQSNSPQLSLLVHHDVRLRRGCIALLAETLGKEGHAVVLYGNHDYLRQDQRTLPQYKTSWDPFLVRHQNYLGSLLCLTELAVNALSQTLTGTHSAYTLGLELDKANVSIQGIPDILYHDLSPADTLYPQQPWELARLKSILQQQSIRSEIHATSYVGVLDIHYMADSNPSVEIIIPYRDHPELLRTCVESLLDHTRYENYKLCLVDNDSSDATVIEYANHLVTSSHSVRYLHFPGEFNYSAINNHAVHSSTADYVLFLNNDTEVTHSGWLCSMIAIALQRDVGTVGAKLLYPDRSIQHAGVELGIGAGAGHVFLGYPEDHPGYMHRLLCHQSYPAVTGACMLTSKELFISLGGFDEENFKVDYNDVDYCLRLRKKGLRNVWCKDAVLMHYESRSRGRGGEKIQGNSSLSKHLAKNQIINARAIPYCK